MVVRLEKSIERYHDRLGFSTWESHERQGQFKVARRANGPELRGGWRVQIWVLVDADIEGCVRWIDPSGQDQLGRLLGIDRTEIDFEGGGFHEPLFESFLERDRDITVLMECRCKPILAVLIDDGLGGYCFRVGP